MEFYNESHLDIKDHDDIPITTQECGGDDIFFKLTLLLSGIIIIFIMALVVLLLLRLKKKSKQAQVTRYELWICLQLMYELSTILQERAYVTW
ncbi:hypothetical protein P4O66_021163 [Electrophorus voltai]|uniref:Uncharacterized protein n=1 Tax=Electrophorus voltai TaxID=2609070 RepID=A0AAD8YQQ9_9TELE|nr:hypothetical protein P4O66_021163 [Electrophorus voltai]